VTSSNRPRRPDLDRDEPHRGFDGVFGAKPDNGANGQPTRALEEDIAQGVGVGYRLIEEYLKRGQQAAQSMWGARAPVPGVSAPGAGMGPERIFEYTAQVMGLWFEMVRNTWPGPTPPTERPGAPSGFDFSAPPPPPSGPSDAAAPPRRDTPVISLDLASSLPLEVTVDLRGECEAKELVAYDLRAADGEIPRLRDIALTWIDACHLRVSLRVPDEQPAATYSGAIVDGATNLPLGTMTVAVRST
jgi:hypothetical protein